MTSGRHDAFSCLDDGTDGDVESIVDLDAIRGWSEHRDPALRNAHRLPALASLVELDDDATPSTVYPIHGPDVLVGRSHFRHPPVDLSLHGLRDHQLYRLGTLHIRLWLDGETWKLRVLSSRVSTAIADKELNHRDPDSALGDGDLLTLGITRFRFSSRHTALGEWHQRQRRLLDAVDTPALFLERFGAPCGPHRLLEKKAPLVVGRTHPGPNRFPDTSQWPRPDDHFWDLSGVFDHERTYLAFRHIAVEYGNDRWTLRPLSPGHQTFLNGRVVSEPVPIHSGDRIGLGSVVVRFHDPDDPTERRPPSEIPEIVDWSEGRRPLSSPPERQR